MHPHQPDPTAVHSRGTLVKLLFYFRARAQDEERAAHRDSQREEYKTVLLRMMSPALKREMAASPGTLKMILDNLTSSPRGDVKQAEAVYKALSKQARAAVEEIWRDQPDVLHISNSQYVLDQLRRTR